MFRRKPKNIDILLHRRGLASVYTDGRYLVVEARVSLSAKRGRDIANDIATAVLKELSPKPEPLEPSEDERREMGEG